MLNLREDARNRLMRLVERTNSWLQSGRVTELAALRSADFLEPLLRRESYLALLWERPVVHERLLKLLGSARWPAKYLLQHPGVMDELAGDAWLTERFNPPEFEAELALRLKSLKSTGEDDTETLLNLLRRAHHAELFRTLARDIEGQLTVEQVADDLSALADTVLRVTIAWCWERHKNKHLDSPKIAIIGYGKLGGKELGYGSDLDIVFIYEDTDENAGEIYSSFVRKLITWLDTKTSEGDLFEIDTALRPNGNSGLLVTSFSAFADYQEKRGSNTAWTWEHQAMTRARFVAGFEPLRCQIRRSSPKRHQCPARFTGAEARNHRHARQSPRRAHGQTRPIRRQTQPRRHARCRIRRAIPRPSPQRRPPRTATQSRQHRPDATR